jgi:DNA primase
MNELEEIGKLMVINKRGINYIGLCPYHTEKTPSFTISPAKEIFMCFGCGKRGQLSELLTYLKSKANENK